MTTPAFKLQFGAISDKGVVRAHNEDSLIVREDLALAAVADGMGGHSSGELASELAVNTLAENLAAFRNGAILPTTPNLDNSMAANALLAAAVQANNKILDEASANPAHSGMGTTLSALTIADDKAVIVHIGDSRVYLCRDGVITQITEDHSLVMEQARKGILTLEEASTSRMQNILTRAMGLVRNAKMDIYEVALQEGDRLLLCSDGLFKAISDEAFAETLGLPHPPEEVCKRLVSLANAGGGPDNITAVAVYVGKRVRPASSPAPAPENAQTADSPAKKSGALSDFFCRLLGKTQL